MPPDDTIGELIRKLGAEVKPGDAAAARRYQRYLNWLRRSPGQWGMRLDKLRRLSAAHNRILQAMRSREAIQLGRYLRAGAEGVPRFFAQIGRGAYALARLAARHPLAVLLLAILVTSLYFYNRSTAVQPQVARRITGPFCDCDRVAAGFLTKEWQVQCRERQAVLDAATAGCGGNLRCVQARLKIKAGPDGTIATGALCSPDPYGDYAWPVQDGPVDPPAVIPGSPEPCTQTSGLLRNCSSQ